MACISLEHIATPSRVMAPFRWFGGKGNMAKKILPYIPDSKIYVEPYAGAASMFWHLPAPRQVEVLNDLHSEIVNLFRVLQDKASFDELEHRLTWTMYSREEFRKALEMGEDGTDVDRAWAFFVRQNQGFGGKAGAESDWGRGVTSSRGMGYEPSKWRGRLKLLETWHDRLSRVQIDNVCALKCIRYWDSADTFFYLDPPYVHSTRKGKEYKHEQDDAHHAELVQTLLGVKGRAILSGYSADVYAPLEESGWVRVDFQTACHAAGKTRGSGMQGAGSGMAKVPRTESIWMSPGLSHQMVLVEST